MSKEINICDYRIINPIVVEETKKKLEKVDIFDKIADFYKIMGDNTRLKIIFALKQNELCVNDIANVIEMSKSSVSHQLRKLREAKIIKNRKDGKEVYYTLDDDHIVEIFNQTFNHISHRIAE